MTTIINTNNNKRYDAFIGLIVIVCWVAFTLSGCATQTKQAPVDAEVAVIEPSPMAVAATASPAVATVKATATDTATAPLTVASLTPTMETATPTPTATTIAMTPNPGWVWYEESEAPGVLFQLPQTWDVRMFRPRRYQAPETNSLIEVRAFDFSNAGDWLAWVQAHESLPSYALADGFVKQNGLVKGRPAFLFLEGGGGSNAIELYIRDDTQIVNIYFHSGVAPRLEQEMQILLTMIETIQFADENEGETSLPTGWVQGQMLTIYSPEQFEFSGDLQTITGTVETWEMFEATIVDAEGISYRFDLGSHYGFQGLPVNSLRPFPNTLLLLETMQSSQSVTLTGYQTVDGHFYLLWGEAVAQDDEMLLLYRPFFDLYRFDPLILSQYPMAATLYLRGSWAQVRAYLIDEPNNALPDSILTLDAEQDVLIKGRLESTDPPRLAPDEFYYLDGECELMTNDVQQCKYYQPIEIEK